MRFIDLWRAGAYELVLFGHLLGELAHAYTDPCYRARISPDHAQRILNLLRIDARLTPLTIPVSGVATHAEDDLVLAIGLSVGAVYLTTRDRKLLALGSYRMFQSVPPGRLLALLESAEQAGR